MLKLEKGVECFSIQYKKTFILHTNVLSWSSNILALTKLMGLTGYNSYKSCYYYNLKGIYSSHIYYPTNSPKYLKGEVYYPANLPLRIYNEFKIQIQKIQNAQTRIEHNQLTKIMVLLKEVFYLILILLIFQKHFQLILCIIL